MKSTACRFDDIAISCLTNYRTVYEVFKFSKYAFKEHSQFHAAGKVVIKTLWRKRLWDSISISKLSCCTHSAFCITFSNNLSRKKYARVNNDSYPKHWESTKHRTKHVFPISHLTIEALIKPCFERSGSFIMNFYRRAFHQTIFMVC